MTKDEFRPEAVELHDSSLRELRGLSERLGVKRRRAYGLAMEFAANNRAEFLTYARENTESTQDGDAGSTQQPP